MMFLADYFATQRGSIVRLSGAGFSVSDIDFHWLEEGACVGARTGVEADVADPANMRLTWRCGCCAPGSAKLSRLSAEQVEGLAHEPGEPDPSQHEFGFFT